MHEKVETKLTPRDVRTGVPLPIYTDYRALEKARHRKPAAETPKVEINRHHAYHPERELVEHGLGSLAVRQSRIQDIWVPEHNRYHRVFEGPQLPATQLEKLKTVVFSAAGAIPDEALVVDEDLNDYTVGLTDAQRERLWRTGIIRMQNPQTVKKFLLEYAVRRGLRDVDQNRVDEFMHTRSYSRRLSLGESIIQAASEEATASFSDEYIDALQDGQLPPDRPPEVGIFVCQLLTKRLDGSPDFNVVNRLESLIAA